MFKSFHGELKEWAFNFSIKSDIYKKKSVPVGRLLWKDHDSI